MNPPPPPPASLPLDQESPCQACGACCAFFRVIFHWRELSDYADDGVPTELTFAVSKDESQMSQTDPFSDRCVALDGTIGVHTSCRIYARRSSVCRDFNPTNPGGYENLACADARRLHGLPPLFPDGEKA